MKSYDWKESNDDWQIFSYELSKISRLVKNLFRIISARCGISKTCITQLFTYIWMKQIYTKTIALTLGLVADPPSLTVTQKRYNKNPTKKAEITRRKFLSYLRNKRLPLWQHTCFRCASQIHFCCVSQTSNKFFDELYFTVIMFSPHFLLMCIWGTAEWNLLAILEGNIKSIITMCAHHWYLTFV